MFCNIHLMFKRIGRYSLYYVPKKSYRIGYLVVIVGGLTDSLATNGPEFDVYHKVHGYCAGLNLILLPAFRMELNFL